MLYCVLVSVLFTDMKAILLPSKPCLIWELTILAHSNLCPDINIDGLIQKSDDGILNFLIAILYNEVSHVWQCLQETWLWMPAP